MKFILIGIITVIVLALVFNRNSRNNGGERRPHDHSSTKEEFREWVSMPEYKRVGIRGEKAAARAVESVLREGDRLFTNVIIEYNGEPAELDIVVVNRYGVFIIEVKNYIGYIVGGEDDYVWQKFKTTDAGNTYERTVKNPIRQVKREIYILAHFLEYYGSRVWVKGYVILLHDNSPVESNYLLDSIASIDRAIHTRDRTILNTDTIEKISKLLS